MRHQAKQAGACAARRALMLTMVVGGCRGILDVDNPSAITEDKLKGDDQSVLFMMNGVQGEFRREYAWLAAHSAAFTDEAIQGHPWSPWNVYDQRAIPPDSPAYDGLSYQLLQRARGTADILIPRMEAALGSRAANSLQLATAYAYAGYAYTMVADFMCESPVNKSKAFSQAELYGMAKDRFEKAVTIAAASPADGSADILSLARVGLARVYLDLGDKANAIQNATGVPSNFAAWVRYTADGSDWQIYNFLQWFAGYRYTGELDLALDPTQFQNTNDTRVPFDPTLRRLADGLRDGLLPYETASYSEWAPGAKVQFKDNTSVRFASGLEARYIIAEAGGLSTSALRAFIDERRVVGAQAAFAGGDGALFAELLHQRAMDFFLDGHRMGDLRRYKLAYQLDYWPKGVMPGLTQSYGTQECWPIAQSELQSNPNLR
jgi:starch-binding outer membrane protein, SusD/RagB family